MKTVSRICNIISSLILAVVIICAGVLVLPRLFGQQPMAVLSGSMEPVYHVGSVVFVDTKATAADIAVGDAITFEVGSGTVVTHRVLTKDDSAQLFTTKGDANEVEDIAPVAFSSLIGRAGFSIPLLGYVATNLTTSRGLVVGCGVIVLLILCFIVPEILKKDEKKAEEAAVTPSAGSAPAEVVQVAAEKDGE